MSNLYNTMDDHLDHYQRLEREEVEKREVVVQLKNVYGNDLIYPVCGNAKKFSALVGKKTFSRTEIAWIKDLGFEVRVEAQQL